MILIEKTGMQQTKDSVLIDIQLTYDTRSFVAFCFQNLTNLESEIDKRTKQTKLSAKRLNYVAINTIQKLNNSSFPKDIFLLSERKRRNFQKFPFWRKEGIFSLREHFVQKSHSDVDFMAQC